MNESHSLSQLSQAGMSWTLSKADYFARSRGRWEIKD